ncbi:hypothetical protein [Sphingomonas sp. PAMC 26621]|uniref:hypothetical protein n=1 Tax=Sphingomonas sp. PAMC 26621 TaxID=1112213 RepID=UPI0002895952|nr:hypothetical protein [Sphingomonas sp. PAMC 26621]
MMLREHSALLRGFVSARVKGRDVVNFADELSAARKVLAMIPGEPAGARNTLAIIPDLDGKAVANALRAAGFNRAREISGRKATTVVYHRRVQK